MTDIIDTASTMAGAWWAERLSDAYDDKRAAFGKAVTELVARRLRGEIAWKSVREEHPNYTVWREVQVPGDGVPLKGLGTEFDYDPDALLEKALRETVGAELSTYKLQGTLPRKHTLFIDLEKARLMPKEGYGNRTADIAIPKALA